MLIQDFQLKLPENSTLKPEDLHFLFYIPWEEKYLDFVPAEFRNFYTEILPFLSARTTDVHTAFCMQYLDEFIHKAESAGNTVNRNVLAYALMLHDSGWSEMSQEEIAASLGVTGLVLTEKAMGPKEKHAVLGEKRARTILTEKQSALGLSQPEIDLICKAIRFHDKPSEVAGIQHTMPIEVQLLADLDHLWSFTHLNFWQDTVRKNISPQTYLESLEVDLDDYFVTTIGKQIAKSLLTERKQEVSFVL